MLGSDRQGDGANTFSALGDRALSIGRSRAHLPRVVRLRVLSRRRFCLAGAAREGFDLVLAWKFD